MQVTIPWRTLLWAFLGLHWAFVRAYTPAYPYNVTADNPAAPTQGGLLDLKWLPYGNNSIPYNHQIQLSYVLAGGDVSPGYSNGVLVYFNESQVADDAKDQIKDDYSFTPWIALISCDEPKANVSQFWDIFTLAHERGAQSALLYSEFSETCMIKPEYTTPQFDRILDVYAINRLSDSGYLNYQMGALSQQNRSFFGAWDPKQLNASGASINNSLPADSKLSVGYIFSTLTASNTTVVPGTDGGNGSGGSSTGSSNDSSTRQNMLAMIVLYVITGCVGVIFVIVIVVGAVRAVRYPDRYGPRRRFLPGMYGGQYEEQTRAQGLGRAILESFPIVKFGSQTPSDADGKLEKRASSDDVEMIPRSPMHGDHEPSVATTSTDIPRQSSSSKIADETASPHSQETAELIPPDIGRDTCPVCIVDFEKDDDLRVLPCNGRHAFHPACVDPWLLNMSSSCPVCRQDFNVLEEMVNESEQTPDAPLSESTENITSAESEPATSEAAPTTRVPRYLQFIRRQRERRQASFSGPPTP